MSSSDDSDDNIGRSRRPQQESDDDSEIDSEEYEDLDNAAQPAKKRKKMSRRGKFDPKAFIIDEAVDEDDDEDDEEYEDEEFANEAAEAAETAKDFENRLRYDQQRNLLDRPDLNYENEEEIERYYRERYSRTAGDRFGEGTEMKDDITQQSMLPGVKDPNLWVVRCRMGDEKNVVLSLMRKMIAYQSTDEPLQIKSVIAKESLKGYIYVEAFKQTHVKQAIEGIGALSIGKWKQQMVPIKEMSDVLKIVKETGALKTGQWVRLKKGIYRDDLARVDEVLEAENLVELMLIPRIDMTRKRGVLRHTGDAAEQDKKKTFKRYPQGLFNRSAIHEIGGETTQENNYVMFEGNRYDSKGFLHKTFNLAAILSEGIKPTLSELEKFQVTGDAVSMENISTSKELSEVTHNLVPGDLVEVSEGELKNLQGKVVRIEGNDITIIPNHDDLKDPLPFPARELRKHFDPGHHVKAIGGRYEGETGLVINVDNNVVIVLSDLNFTEFKASIKDLQLCQETSTGVDQAGHYQFGDLVQIDPQTVGVITRLEKEHFSILTMQDKVIRVKQNAILRRRENRTAQAIDADGNYIQPKDVVKIAEGPHSGFQGEIRHIYRSWAFIYCRMHSENGGIFVARTRHVQLAGGGTSRGGVPPVGGGIAARMASPAHPSSGGGGGPPQSMGRGVPIGPDKTLMGQTVRITQGQFKNHIGIVKDVSDSTVRVELHAQYKIITVDKGRVTPVDGPRAGVRPTSTYGRTPLHGGGQTPGYGMGSRTPMYGHGGQTPMHESGSRTPHYGGGMTPRADGSSTPGHVGSAWDPNTGNSSRTRYPDTFEYDDIESPSAMASAAPLTPANRVGLTDPSPLSSDFSPSPSAVHFSPMTPGVAMPYTPNTPGGPLHNSQVDGIDWVTEDIVVTIKPSYDDDVELRGREAHVKGVSGASVSVYLPHQARTVNVHVRDIQPKAPDSGDKVKIIAGEERLKTGQCLSVDTNEGVVKIDSGPLKLLNLALLAKMVDTND